MPITVYLRDERGSTLDFLAGEGVIETLLPPAEDQASPCLRFVDRYGDTVFNSLQAGLFKSELLRRAEHLPDKSQSEVIERIASLADRCADEMHLYLWLVGD